jgi:two-component system LytT family sensor kinase
MNLKGKYRHIWRTALIIFGAYTALLCVNLPSVYYFNTQREQPADFWILTIRLVGGMYLWVFPTLFILWVGNIFRIARPNLWRNVFIHLMVAVLVGLVRPPIENAVFWVLGITTSENLLADLSRIGTYIRSVTGAIVTYPSVIGIQQAYFYFRESQERAFNLQQAELRMLKMQIHPHFFFNTLNAISALMYRSPKDADQMIIRLGDMFRIALKKEKTQEVTLAEELEFLQAFLQIHQTLMGKRLQIKSEIAPETLDALVPNLILQPLAENAIQHGLAPLEAGGQIKISAARENGDLFLQVADNGSGLDPAAKHFKDGIGLSNVRARLANLYGDKHDFSIGQQPEGGVRVEIRIPFRERTTN